MTESIDALATALSQGVNVFEELGKLYCQVQAQKLALDLAIATIQAQQQIQAPPEVPTEAPPAEEKNPEAEAN